MSQPVSTFDPYTALMHSMGLDPSVTPQWSPPSWYPMDARRRLHAYRILSSYQFNAARFNRVRLSQEARRKTREYGDPALLVDRIVAGILGQGATVTVRGAAQPPLDAPDLPPYPDEPNTGSPGIDADIQAIQVEVWEARAAEIVDQWSQAHADYPGLQARQDWLDEWWADEQVASKLYEAESSGAVPLGDGVVVLGWSTEKQRPTVTVYEPDAYHPVLTDANEDYPTKVHLAWSFEDDNGDEWLRRITYELVDYADAEGEEARTFDYPWQEEPSTIECLLTDATWSMKGQGLNWPSLEEADATFGVNEDGEELNAFPIGVDFIPVVHIPNTPNTTGHFGVSSLSNVAQLLDDVASNDTNVMSAAALAGSPTIGAAGVNVAEVKVKAGTIINLPENGKLYPIDMSGPLTALLGLHESMLDRLSIVSQVPGVVLGRVSGDDVPSGVALSLSFAPFEQLVAVLRLTRHVKYGLVVKFAQRFAQVGGTLDPGPTPKVDIAFATTIPADVAATVEQVARLLEANGIPRAMALTVLRDAGYPVDDLDEALAQIAGEDPEGAKAMADALGSEQAAAEYLGVSLNAGEANPDAFDDTVNPVAEDDGADDLDELPPPL